ncbi:DUF2760 domain-containing protein [Chitinispirillales bacterium ANBcel5]|uniref:DUF2760 domain-containing protein n=1 Tax=Cellulosispirillum alkaliphilum TaxID=3039283 RepID=UPI002A547F41|nr:DUF2760 domain-containing protein [Chitinispirillales bacterium ANBcel5]
MNRFELAIRTFFWIFFNKKFREEILPFFEERPLEIAEKKPEIEEVPKEEEKPARSDAIALLSLLQREGRLVDFFMEPIDAYSDAQIGAAVRDVHRGCATVLDNSFGVEPVLDKQEGEEIEIVADFDPEKYRLTGNVSGNPPYKGVLRHHGWKASRCELPVWQGSDESVDIVAPAELELP